MVRPVRDGCTALLDFLYPPVCAVCLVRAEGPEDRPVCRSCRGRLRRAEPSDPHWVRLARALTGQGGISGILACYLFEKGGVLQDCLHLLKYGGLTILGEFLGRELGELILASPEFRACGVLVPVPLHPARLRERGFNQSEIICRGIASLTGQAVSTSVLRRLRNTPTQTALGHGAREENVRGAFGPARGGGADQRGARVILVDDVMTTGSTVKSCAGELLSAGFREVYAVSVAMAP